MELRCAAFARRIASRFAASRLERGSDVRANARDVKPENWSAGSALMYGGIHVEAEQVFGS